MKKIYTIVLLLALLLTFTVGCGRTAEDNGKINVIATVFPAYDFAREIAGDAANVSMLLPVGSESHSYEPSAKDIINISRCDLFIYTGGESDSWVEDVLDSLDTSVNTLKMMDAVTLYETVHTHEHGKEYDEHVWTSPENARSICRLIADALSALDRDNAAVYEANFTSYADKLDALDHDFKTFFEGVSNKTLVFGDRFPFMYFAKHYGLDYISPFPGCASETEPSMTKVAEIIDKVRSDGITTVFYIEFSNHKIADAIAEATGAETKLFHSCHNVSAEELSRGVNYIGLMRENLETLKGSIK